jgi:hypothetical protein
MSMICGVATLDSGSEQCIKFVAEHLKFLLTTAISAGVAYCTYLITRTNLKRGYLPLFFVKEQITLFRNDEEKTVS